MRGFPFLTSGRPAVGLDRLRIGSSRLCLPAFAEMAFVLAPVGRAEKRVRVRAEEDAPVVDHGALSVGCRFVGRPAGPPAPGGDRGEEGASTRLSVRVSTSELNDAVWRSAGVMSAKPLSP